MIEPVQRLSDLRLTHAQFLALLFTANLWSESWHFSMPTVGTTTGGESQETGAWTGDGTGASTGAWTGDGAGALVTGDATGAWPASFSRAASIYR